MATFAADLSLKYSFTQTMKRSSLKRITGLYYAAMLLAVASCTQEKPTNPDDPDGSDPIPEEMVEIAISVPHPDMFESAMTRALTLEQESTVSELDVLVFEQNGGLIDIVSAVKRSTNLPTQQFGISVQRAKVEGKTLHVVALANSSEEIKNVLGSNPDQFDGMRYDDLVAKFTTPVTGVMYASRNAVLPMSGESRGIKINESAPTKITVRLARAVARVDIGVGQATKSTGTDYGLSWNGLDDKGKAIPFEPTDIYIARPGSMISLLPARASVNNEGKIVAPTLHADNKLFAASESWNRFLYTFDGKLFSTQEIYIPETRQTGSAASDGQHTSRIALIVGGKYNGSSKTTYYRVNFTKEDALVDIVRNRFYQFNIKSVNFPGLSTPMAAYESASMGMDMGMSVEMLEWEEGLVEDIWWGESYLAVRRNPVELPAGENQTTVATIFTNADPLQLEMGEHTLTAGGTCSTQWVDYSLEMVAEGEYSLSMKTLANNISPTKGEPRVEKWKIRAGDDISMALEVTQIWRTDTPTGKFTITVQSSGKGVAEADFTEADAGDKVTLTAKANKGYEFTGWRSVSGDVILANPSAPVTAFVMPKNDVTVSADFATITYGVTVTSAGHGTAHADAQKQGEGVPVQLTATPDPGYEFVQWTAVKGVLTDLDTRDPQAVFTMPPSEVELKAEFRVIKYKVTFEIAGAGTATNSEVAGICSATSDPLEAELAQQVTITADPDPRYEFAGWEVLSGDVNLTNPELPQTTFHMLKSNVHIRARFDHKMYNITVADDGNGTLKADVAKAKAGTIVTLTAKPTIDETRDYMFEGWADVKNNAVNLKTTSSSPETTTGTFTMPQGDVEVKAIFRIRDYEVKVVTDGKGSVTSSATRSIAGETISISATPPTGYTFVGWTVVKGDIEVTGGASATFVTSRGDVEVRADFAHIPVEPYLLFLDYNGRMAAGQWKGDGSGPVTQKATVTQDNLLYFKHGSLVGMTTPDVPTNTSWPASFPQTKFFNPTDIVMHTGSNIQGTSYEWLEHSGYGEIPGYDYKDEKTGSIDSDRYNSAENMAAGLGDPCRLIGLNADEAKAMAKAGTLPNRKNGYMTPPSTYFSTNYIPVSKTEWVTVGGRDGRWLTSSPDATTFLPAAGNRDRWNTSNDGGAVMDVGVGGFYLHNENKGGTAVYLYVFYEVDDPEGVNNKPPFYTSSMMYSQPKQEAAVVRCVKK
jgi:hypothetical protein